MQRALTYGILILALFASLACSRGERENQAASLSEMALIEFADRIYDADCVREGGEAALDDCNVDDLVDGALGEADTRLFVWRAGSFGEADLCQYLFRRSSCFQRFGIQASGSALCRSGSLRVSASGNSRCGNWLTALAAGKSCDQILALADTELNRINGCNVDSDCVLWDPHVNCERGLGHNRRADTGRLQSLYRAYRGACVTEPVMCTMDFAYAERACVNNRCVSGVDGYGSL